MAHIGIDLDGVMYPFHEDARIVVADYLHIHPIELDDAKCWDFMTDQWGVDQKTFWQIWFEDVARGNAWLRMPPADGTVEGIHRLRDAGHSTHIITSRKGGEVATVNWIHKYDIPYDTLHIGRDKTRVNVDLLVDDWEQNWCEITDSGGRCLLWDQPWNAHVVDAERVFTWYDVLDAVS